MAGSINKVILVGNLGKDPEVRHAQDGSKVVSFPIATSETWKDKGGERQERTEWHRVVIFSPGLADVASKYLKKGAKVYVEGQLRTRKWTDQAGQEKYTTEVILSGYNALLTMLDRTGSGSEATMATDAPKDSGWDAAPAPAAPTAPGGGGTSDLDDDIPF